MSRSWLWLCGISFALVVPAHAYAHSFGTAYVLPIPLWMYMYGAAATLIVTFAMLAYFSTTPSVAASPRAPAPRPNVPSERIRVLDWRVLEGVRAAAVGAFVLM